MAVNGGWSVRNYTNYDDLPVNYYLEKLGTAEHPILCLRYFSAGEPMLTLGIFTAIRDIAADKILWSVKHNFRSSHYDTLDMAIKMTIAKHRLGAFSQDKNRQVF